MGLSSPEKGECDPINCQPFSINEIDFPEDKKALEKKVLDFDVEEVKSIKDVKYTSSTRSTTLILGISEDEMKIGISGKSKPVTDEEDVHIEDPLNQMSTRTVSNKFETYPQGFPRLAAFQNSSSGLAIFRRFGTAHCRVLMHLQCEITTLIQELDDLDISDSAENSELLYRLRRNEWYEGWDTGQKDLLERLQRKLVIYDDLLLKDRGLRALAAPLPHHYQSLSNWIIGTKPLDKGQYDFLFSQDDFVLSSANSHQCRFDEAVQKVLFRWPEIFKKFMGESGGGPQVHGNRVYSLSRNKAACIAKLLAVMVAVTILTLPVLLLYLNHMSDGARGGVVLISIMTFGVVMSQVVGARVEAVFIGTCTYSAVLVTFLGNLQASRGTVGEQ